MARGCDAPGTGRRGTRGIAATRTRRDGRHPEAAAVWWAMGYRSRSSRLLPVPRSSGVDIPEPVVPVELEPAWPPMLPVSYTVELPPTPYGSAAVPPPVDVPVPVPKSPP